MKTWIINYKKEDVINCLFGFYFCRLAERTGFLNCVSTRYAGTFSGGSPCRFLRKYAFGQYVRTLDKGRLAQLSGYSLGEVLQQETGLFLRQYGPGMLASLSMRGTSAGHNALFWNGLPVNSPSLGQADYSIFPVGGFDAVNIHYGVPGLYMVQMPLVDPFICPQILNSIQGMN